MQDVSQKRNHAPYLYLTRPAAGLYDLYILIPVAKGKKVVFPEQPQLNPDTALFAVRIEEDNTAMRASDRAALRPVSPLAAGCPADREDAFEIIVEVYDEANRLLERNSMFCEDADAGAAAWVNDETAYNCPYLFFSKSFDAAGEIQDFDMSYILPLEGFTHYGVVEEEAEGRLTHHIFLIKTDAGAADAVPAAAAHDVPLESPAASYLSAAARERSFLAPGMEVLMADGNPPDAATAVAEEDSGTQPVTDFAVEVYLTDNEEEATARRVLIGSVFERAAGGPGKKRRGRVKQKPSLK
jgi:hypothetical protein